MFEITQNVVRCGVGRMPAKAHSEPVLLRTVQLVLYSQVSAGPFRLRPRRPRIRPPPWPWPQWRPTFARPGPVPVVRRVRAQEDRLDDGRTTLSGTDSAVSTPSSPHRTPLQVPCGPRGALDLRIDDPLGTDAMACLVWAYKNGHDWSQRLFNFTRHDFQARPKFRLF